MESKDIVTRPALGCSARLGELFDARTDTFLNVSIFKQQPPSSCISSTDSHTTKVSLFNTESFADKVSGYNLSAGLTLKMLSGLLGDVDGSGKFLQNETAKTKSTKSALMHSITTKVEKLEIYDVQLQECISKDALESASDEDGATATHVVVRIDWGAKIVVTAEETTKAGIYDADAKGNLDVALTKLMSSVKIQGSAGASKNVHIDDNMKNYSIQIYGDILPKGGSCGWDQMQDLVQNFSSLLQEANGGKGKSISYGLIPIKYLQIQFKVPVTIYKWHQIDNDIVNSFVTIFDGIQILKKALIDFMQEIKEHDYCLTEEDIEEAEKLNFDFVEADIKLKTELKEALIGVRDGTVPVERFNELRSKYSIQKCEVFKTTESFVKNRGHKVGNKISLANKLISNQIQYFKRGESEETLTLGTTVYIFYVGKDAQAENHQLFQETLRFFFELVKITFKNYEGNEDSEEKPKFIFVDCSIHEKIQSEFTKQVTIQCYRKGILESEDMYRDYKEIPTTRKFELISNGNYGELLTALGIGMLKWYAIMKSYSTVYITEEDKRYTIKIVTSVGTVESTFVLNETFGEQTADGYDAQSLVSREVNSLVHFQTLSNPGSMNPKRKTVRTFTKTEMRVTMTANGVTATRVYKRIA